MDPGAATFVRADVLYVDRNWADPKNAGGQIDDIYQVMLPVTSKRAEKQKQLDELSTALKGAVKNNGNLKLAVQAAMPLPASLVAPAKKVARKPMAEVCDEHGLEVHGNDKGGALSAAHIAHLDKDTFQNGLHKPKFHEDGLHKPVKSGEKEFETGFHYLLHCHELGGKNPDGGYGGPLCKDPYGAEVTGIVNRLLKEAEEDKTLAFDNFSFPCPQLTKEQVAICKGHDYGDKTQKLPMGPLPWPAGLPPPGYVPQTDPLHGRWITVSGGQKAFIKAAIEAGMLGKAEASKIQADTDHHQTGGMYLRINQHGETCTVDASVAKFARAKRTWKSGHYFYEPLVSGGNLFGVWVLPEEYRKIGFFWEMESGRCFRIERRAFPAGPYMFLRQATEVNGKISFVFYVKVDNDPGSSPIPLQSRCYTALAGQNNVCDNLGKPYPCTAKDLDYPVKRDTWLDQNEKEMLVQRKLVAGTFAKISEQDFVGMGWSSKPLDGVTLDGLWEALIFKARNPQEVMDVSDVVVQDRKGFLWRSMYVKAKERKVVEHIYCNERNGEICYRVVDFRTKRELEDERVIEVKQNPLRLEFFHRHKTDGYRAYWPAPVSIVEGVVEEIVKLAKKLENNSDSKVGLGMHSDVITGVSHDALWRSMLKCVREPEKFIKGLRVTKMDCKKANYVQRTTKLKGRLMSRTENIYTYESACEVCYREVSSFGNEADIERVVALRSMPLQLEFHTRNRKDGFRVDWKLPKTVIAGLVESYIREAKKMDAAKPSKVGYGVTSDPITGVNYDSLLIAVNKTVMDPSLTATKKWPIAEGSTEIEEADGYINRSYRLVNGMTIKEKVSIFEEVGEVVFCKLNEDGSDGPFERVIAFHTGPLRMELYERDTTNDVRVSWNEPYASATGYFEKIVNIARKVEKENKDVVGYGVASKSITGMNSDSCWKAMLYQIRNPHKAGMKVTVMKMEDKAGYLERTMQLDGVKGKPVKMDRIYIDERVREVIYRDVQDGKEADDERVFVIRENPLRMEMYSRHSYDKLRVFWKAPRNVATVIFDEVVELGRLLHNDPRAFDEKYGRKNNDAAYNAELLPPAEEKAEPAATLKPPSSVRSNRSTSKSPRRGRAPVRW